MVESKVQLRRQVIEGAQAADKPYRIWDTKVPGLFLRVQPSGKKTYNVAWRRTTSKSIGKHPVMTLDGARTQALAILSDAAANGTPEAAKPRNKVSTLGDFLDLEYGPWVREHRKDAAATLQRIRRFEDFLDKPLPDITPWLLEKWRSARLKDGKSSATVNRDIVSLKAALSKAVEWKFLAAAPKVKPLKTDKAGVIRYLNPEEEGRLRAALEARDGALIEARARTIAANRKQHEGIAALPANGFGDHLTPLVITAMNTGLRRGELTSLTWLDVDLQAKRLVIHGRNAKSGSTRHIPLNAEAVPILKRWRQQNPEAVKVFDLLDAKKAWATLLASAKIKDFRFHDLRHHFASKLVMAGVDLNTVRELLGHSTLTMTMRYAHLAPEHKAAAVERLVAVL